MRMFLPVFYIVLMNVNVSITTKFLELGYAAIDLYGLSVKHEVNSTRQLTDRSMSLFLSLSIFY
jgi:hypothetical protein